MLHSMPGNRRSIPLPRLTPQQAELSQALQRHVQALARPRNFHFYPALQATADYLERELATWGYTVERQAYQAEGQTFENIEARTGPEPFVLVGAHYDSVLDCPGANDNGSGVAAGLEMARLLAGRPGYRFVFFANEEPPFYRTPDMGSVRYVERMRHGHQPIRWMLCLETLGYYRDEPGTQRSPIPGMPDRGNFVAIVGNHASAERVRQLVGAWRERVDFPCEGLAPTLRGEPALTSAGMGMSDHANFWAVGIPAVMVTDTVFHRYPYYHDLEDTWEKLTYEPFARVVDGLVAVLQ